LIQETLVYLIDDILFLPAPSDVRLVCDSDKKETLPPEPVQRRSNVVRYDQLLQAGRRVGLSLSDYSPIEHSIAIQKDGPLFRTNFHFDTELALNSDSAKLQLLAVRVEPVCSTGGRNYSMAAERGKRFLPADTD